MHWLQGENWTELLKEVVTFDSVEEFWGVYVCSLPHSLPLHLHPALKAVLPCLY